MRFIGKFFLILAVLLGCLSVFAQGLPYRSDRGNSVRIELKDSPRFHAIVYEPTYGALVFDEVRTGAEGVLFENRQVGMQMFLSKDIKAVLFVSASGDKELYMLQRGSNLNSMSTDFSTSTPKRDKCYTCHGFLTCPVCSGSGRTVSYNGNPAPQCSACHGTGRCYHCHGTGLQ